MSFLEGQLGLFQDLWACLEDLDSNAWVLEPLSPRRRDLFRRLVLGPQALLLLRLSAQQRRRHATARRCSDRTRLFPCEPYVGEQWPGVQYRSDDCRTRAGRSARCCHGFRGASSSLVLNHVTE